MDKRNKNRILDLRLVILLLFLCSGLGILLNSNLFVRTAGSAPPESKDEISTEETKRSTVSDYSKFSHSVPQHKRQCSACHVFPSKNWESVRNPDEAIPDITDYPKHNSCLNCHRRQFFSGPRPVICRTCHTNPSPRNSSRHPFPNPRELFDASEKGKRSFSRFDIYFPHEMHVAMMGENSNPILEKEHLRSGHGFITRAGLRSPIQSETCATCHQTYLPLEDGGEEYVTKPPDSLGDGFWLKTGTFKSSPINHLQCFTCHSADSGLSPAPSDCGTCHKLKEANGPKTDFDPELAKLMGITDKIMLTSWRKRNSAARFRHEWFSHVELDCATCHTTSDIDTVNSAVKTVRVSSCSGCHLTATSEEGGNLNIEIDSRKSDPKFQCVKCHLAYSGLPIPESHFKAISDLAGK